MNIIFSIFIVGKNFSYIYIYIRGKHLFQYIFDLSQYPRDLVNPCILLIKEFLVANFHYSYTMMTTQFLLAIKNYI